MNYEPPRLVTPDVHDAKDEIRSVMLRYLQLPSERRNDAAWMIRALEDRLRGVGISEGDISSFFPFGPFWTDVALCYARL